MIPDPYVSVLRQVVRTRGLLEEIMVQRMKLIDWDYQGPNYTIEDSSPPDMGALNAAGVLLYGVAPGDHWPCGIPRPVDDPDRRSCLLRAAALCVAELERMERATARACEPDEPDDSKGGEYDALYSEAQRAADDDAAVEAFLARFKEEIG